MTTMSPSAAPPPRTRAIRALLAVLMTGSLLAGLGCGTSQPGPVQAGELAEAQTFPYFPVYWAGPRFEGFPITAADGLRGYIEKVGDSVYYGDCVKSKGIFGGGSCQLPLQVTTVIYHLHLNGPLGPQYNMLVRGVPATVYDEGRSIEIYTGRTAIDIFSDSFAHAIAATRYLLPINAPGSASRPLPLPVFCPGLAGAVTGRLAYVMEHLPRHACQRDAASLAFAKQLKS
jgi:hypothetical protein